MANRKRAAQHGAPAPETKGVLATTAKTLGAALGAVAAKIGIASPEMPTTSAPPKKKASIAKRTRSRQAAGKSKRASATQKAKTPSR